MWYVIKREVVDMETTKDSESIGIRISKREISGREKIIIETCFFILKYIFQRNIRKMSRYGFAKKIHNVLYVDLKLLEPLTILPISRKLLKASEYANIERSLTILWKATEPCLEQLLIEGWQKIAITDHLALE